VHCVVNQLTIGPNTRVEAGWSFSKTRPLAQPPIAVAVACSAGSEPPESKPPLQLRHEDGRATTARHGSVERVNRNNHDSVRRGRCDVAARLTPIRAFGVVLGDRYWEHEYSSVQVVRSVETIDGVGVNGLTSDSFSES
jgi:hypothetical protein